MAIVRFPPPETADESGLLALGGDLEVESLLLAYSQGIFPWPIPEEELIPWFAPKERALLFLDDLHPGRSTRKAFGKHQYRFSIDSNFSAVIQSCRSSWIERHGSTWLSSAMLDAYSELHTAGFAHSVECYKGNQLVGGLYGVSIGSMFAGESMFHIAPDASKLCLYFLADYMRERGAKWIDCQVMNPFFESLGARLVPREEFLVLLSDALPQPGIFSTNC